MYNFFWIDKELLSLQNFELINVLGGRTPKPQKGQAGELHREHEKKHRSRSTKAKPRLWFQTRGIMEIQHHNEVKYEKRQFFLVKSFNNDHPMNTKTYDHAVECFKRQNSKLLKLEHPNILKNWLLLDTGNSFYIVRPYSERGCITDIIYALGFIPEPLAQKYFKQLVDAVSYLHDNGIIHGNIKCQNVLIDQHDRILLSDIHVGETIKANLKYFNTGPLYYKAPELITGSVEYSRSISISVSEEFLKHLVKNVNRLTFSKYVYCLSDVWSLGIVLFIMLWGKAPFTIEEYQDILYGADVKPVPKIPSKSGALSVSVAAKRLYTRMLSANLTKRPRAKEILYDKWTQSDMYNFKQKQKLHFENAWTHFYKQGENISSFKEQSKNIDDYNLAKLRIDNQIHISSVEQNYLNNVSCIKEKSSETKEEFYATFIPANIETDRWMSDGNKIIFSAKQKESLRLCNLGILSSLPNFSCYKPKLPASELNVGFEVIWIQSKELKSSKYSKNLVVYPVIGLVRGGQLHHAVLYRLEEGKPLMSSPRYALLFIKPEMVEGLQELSWTSGNSNKREDPPQSFEDPEVWEYLQSIIEGKKIFSSEFVRLSLPLVEKLRLQISSNQGRISETMNILPSFIRRAIQDLEFKNNKFQEINYCKKN